MWAGPNGLLLGWWAWWMTGRTARDDEGGSDTLSVSQQSTHTHTMLHQHDMPRCSASLTDGTSQTHSALRKHWIRGSLEPTVLFLFNCYSHLNILSVPMFILVYINQWYSQFTNTTMQWFTTTTLNTLSCLFCPSLPECPVFCWICFELVSTLHVQVET